MAMLQLAHSLRDFIAIPILDTVLRSVLVGGFCGWWPGLWLQVPMLEHRR